MNPRTPPSSVEVTTELFASPLNHTLGRFCSIWKDVDRYFGSLGSAFDLFPPTGSFEVNPPFDLLSVRQAFDQLKLVFELAQHEADHLTAELADAVSHSLSTGAVFCSFIHSFIRPFIQNRKSFFFFIFFPIIS